MDSTAYVMDSILLTKVLVALGPALALLFVFDRLDAFNLISARVIALLFGVGGALAALSFIANWRVLDGFPIGFSAYTRYVAPLIEESLKAAPFLLLYRFNRIGFKLDAAIAGFAIGAGFASIENIWYLFVLPDANVSAWMVRGFGTAVMHSGATALFAVVSHEMLERQATASSSHYRLKPWSFAPGIGLAIVAHSAFNHLAGAPLLAMAATLLLIPATLFLALSHSERATQMWLRTDEATHRRMLADIRSGLFAQTPAGQALTRIAANLPPAIRADFSTYVALKVELVLRAEEMILASHSGEGLAVTDVDIQSFARLRALDRQFGKSVVAAVHAQLGFSLNDVWELERASQRAQQA